MGVFRWRGRRPNLRIVNEEFDPGKMGMVPYFTKDDESGMWIFDNEGVGEIQGYQKAIWRQRQADPTRHSRVILVGSESQIEPLEEVINQNGFVPVRMEPLIKA